MEREAENARRMERQKDASGKREISLGSIILTVWKGWCSRMEAEGRRDKVKENLNPTWMNSIECS